LAAVGLAAVGLTAVSVCNAPVARTTVICCRVPGFRSDSATSPFLTIGVGTQFNAIIIVDAFNVANSLFGAIARHTFGVLILRFALVAFVAGYGAHAAYALQTIGALVAIVATAKKMRFAASVAIARAITTERTS